MSKLKEAYEAGTFQDTTLHERTVKKLIKKWDDMILNTDRNGGNSIRRGYYNEQHYIELTDHLKSIEALQVRIVPNTAKKWGKLLWLIPVVGWIRYAVYFSFEPDQYLEVTWESKNK